MVCKAIFAPWCCATLWVHFYLGRGSRFGALFSWKVCLNLISSPLFMFFICHSLWVYVFVSDIVMVNKCVHICMVWDLLSEIRILRGGFSSPRTVCYLDQRWDTGVTRWEGVMSILMISLKRQVQGSHFWVAGNGKPPDYLQVHRACQEAWPGDFTARSGSWSGFDLAND